MVHGRSLGSVEFAIAAALGLAFGIDGILVIEVPIILAVCLWYLVRNGRTLFPAVLHDRLAVLVIALFMAIALKDGLFLLAGSGSLKAFAKSSSRILVLAGVAVLVHSHDRRTLERMYLVATGVGASLMALLFLLMRANVLPWFLNENSFGMIAVWFPLGVVALWHREYARAKVQGAPRLETIPPPRIQAAFAGFVLLVLLIDAFVFEPQGSRTAPVAFVSALLIGVAPRPKWRTNLTMALLVLVTASLLLITLQPVSDITELLTNRPRVWQAFLTMALKRPLTGWGWTDAADNLKLVTPLVELDARYTDIATIGYGPHNSLLALAFENGFPAAILFIILLVIRIRRSRESNPVFDAALPAWIIFTSFDAILPGGLTALGFLLSWVILAPSSIETGGVDDFPDSDRIDAAPMQAGRKPGLPSRFVFKEDSPTEVQVLRVRGVPGEGSCRDAP